MKNYISIFLLISLLFSCKEETETKKSTKEKQPLVNIVDSTLDNVKYTNGNYQLIFNGIFEKDDLMLVYFTEKVDETLSSEKFKTVKIKGSPNPQSVVFNFDNNVKPYDFRVDFSDNKLQQDVKFINMVFVDAYNKVVINNINFTAYFDFNNEMTFNRESSLLRGIIFEKDGKEAYNPYFTASNSLVEVLNNMHLNSINKKNVSLINDEFNIVDSDEVERIIIRGEFKSDDLVEIYYAENSLEEFSSEKKITSKINGKDVIQDVVFLLPEKTYPIKVRLDISDNRDQKGIEIESFHFIIGKDKLEILQKDFGSYFVANNYINFNPNNGKFDCKYIEENGNKNYNPYFVSTPKLIKKLQIL
jgi:hypothetical protein